MVVLGHRTLLILSFSLNNSLFQIQKVLSSDLSTSVNNVAIAHSALRDQFLAFRNRFFTLLFRSESALIVEGLLCAVRIQKQYHGA